MDQFDRMRLLLRNAGARRAVPGSVAFVPSAMGSILAGEVVRAVAGVSGT